MNSKGVTRRLDIITSGSYYQNRTQQNGREVGKDAEGEVSEDGQSSQ